MFVPNYGGLAKITNEDGRVVEQDQTIPELQVLIVDDFCETGNSLTYLKDFFVAQYGIDARRIRAACLVARSNAQPEPQLYEIGTNDHIWYLPWGKIR